MILLILLHFRSLFFGRNLRKQFVVMQQLFTFKIALLLPCNFIVVKISPLDEIEGIDGYIQIQFFEIRFLQMSENSGANILVF